MPSRTSHRIACRTYHCAFAASPYLTLRYTPDRSCHLPYATHRTSHNESTMDRASAVSSCVVPPNRWCYCLLIHILFQLKLRIPLGEATVYKRNCLYACDVGLCSEVSGGRGITFREKQSTAFVQNWLTMGVSGPKRSTGAWLHFWPRWVCNTHTHTHTGRHCTSSCSRPMAS